MKPENYEQAVAFEDENRRLAYLGLGRPLLGLCTGALTWRQVIELSLVRNAFFSEAEPTRSDVFQVLWRINAYYTQPSGRLPNLPASAARPSWLARRMACTSCYLVSSRNRANKLELPIREWIDLAFQDVPSMTRTGEDEAPSIFAPRLYWYDTVQHFYLERHITGEQVLDMSVAATFQAMRSHYIAHGNEFKCIPPSMKFKKFEEGGRS